MPMVNITFDKRFEDALAEHAAPLVDELTTVIVDVIEAKPEDCQFVLSTALVNGAAPICLTVHFRESDSRPVTRVEAMLEQLGERIDARFGASVRLRGFPVHQPTLAAVNYQSAKDR